MPSIKSAKRVSAVLRIVKRAVRRLYAGGYISENQRHRVAAELVLDYAEELTSQEMTAVLIILGAHNF